VSKGYPNQAILSTLLLHEFWLRVQNLPSSQSFTKTTCPGSGGKDSGQPRVGSGGCWPERQPLPNSAFQLPSSRPWTRTPATVVPQVHPGTLHSSLVRGVREALLEFCAQPEVLPSCIFRPSGPVGMRPGHPKQPLQLPALRAPAPPSIERAATPHPSALFTCTGREVPATQTQPAVRNDPTASRGVNPSWPRSRPRPREVRGVPPAHCRECVAEREPPPGRDPRPSFSPRLLANSPLCPHIAAALLQLSRKPGLRTCFSPSKQLKIATRILMQIFSA